MRSLHRLALVAAVAAVTSGAGIFLGFIGTPQVEPVVEFSGVTLAAILISAFAIPRSGAKTGATMPPSFVFTFAVLLLFGRNAAMLVAAACAVTSALVHWRLAHPLLRIIANIATVLGTLAAALAYQALGGPVRPFDWPWHVAPIAATALAYCIVTSASADLLFPLLARRPIDRAWPTSLLGAVPTYVIEASIAVGLVEIFDHRAWQVFVAVAFPLVLLYRAYVEHLNHRADDSRRREVIGSLGEGMCVVDAKGRVILWNDALEQVVGCPRDRALGSPVLQAVPALANTELRRAIDEATASQSARKVV